MHTHTTSTVELVTERTAFEEAEIAAAAFLARYSHRQLTSTPDRGANHARATGADASCQLSAVRRSNSPAPTGGLADYRHGVGQIDLVDVRDGVRGGQPCFVGTRIAVCDVLEYLAGGMTTAEIVHAFPELTEAHVRAALEFAALRERRLAAPA